MTPEKWHSTSSCGLHRQTIQGVSTILNRNLEIEYHTYTSKKKNTLISSTEKLHKRTKEILGTYSVEWRKKKGFIYSNTKARQQTIAFSAVGWIYFLLKHPAKLILWFKSEMSPNAADLEGLKKGYCIGRVPTLSMAQSICVYTWMD